MQDRNIFLDPDLSLNKLANILEIKPNYLSQTINQFHEQNFFEFINTFRIREAKRLLCKTTMKVVAVAYDAGFNSLSTFNSVFKKATGTTPSRFRKSCPENTDDRNSQAASRR
jgi:YesN/AraC family two-component response regulator